MPFVPLHVPDDCPLPWVPPPAPAETLPIDMSITQRAANQYLSVTMALQGRSHHPHSLNEETEAQSNVTSCPEITTPLSEVKGWESKDMAREGWREALPESQRPRPGDYKGPPRSLPQPRSAAEQSCCHKKPGLALGPDPLQTNPPSAVPFSSTDGPNSIHPPNPPPPGNYPSILLSLPGTSRPTHHPMFVVSFHHRPSHRLFSWSVGHIIRKSSSKKKILVVKSV